MNKFKAKVVMKDKFWIVESNGTKVGSLHKTDHGFTLIGEYKGKPKKERFDTQSDLKAKYNIVFDTTKQITTTNKNHFIYGFPCKTKPFNDMYDVKRKLPIFTKNDKSKSFYCAGYYIVKFDTWMSAYCPKMLTLTRYDFVGPFKTELEMKQVLKKYNDETK